MIKYISIFSFLLMLAFSITNCKRDASEVTVKTLFNLVITQDLFFYKGNPVYLASDPSSPHDKFMRVNFNDKAASVLGKDGRLPVGGTFPDESLIVKETSTSAAGALTLYAVMYKMPKASNSGSGWVWAEYKSDGTAQTKAGNKGSKCISCHSGAKQRDLVKTFDLH